MKKGLLFILDAILLFSFVACGGVSSTTTDDIQKVYEGDKKILIAYFTLVGVQTVLL